MTGIRLADRMSRLGTESAFEVLARARAIEDAGGKVIHLEIGEPDFPTAPHIVEAAVEALHAGATHYVPAPGIPPLRQAVAAFLEHTGRMRVTPDRVIITPGAKPIMFFTILALAGEGDEVLYPDPGFPMYESIASFAGAVPVPVPLRERNGFRIDTDELERLITDRTRLLIINSPHNPCGSALTREDCEAIAAIALRHDLVVLTDEVYWAIRYGAEHASVLDVPGMADRTILLDGWSKTFAMTGWRLGFGVFGRVPARPGGAGHPAGHQLRLVHVGVQSVRRDRRPGRPVGPGRGDGGRVPPPPGRRRGRPQRHPRRQLPGAAGRVLRLP
jgi:aspartate/methionine/tyrosine aminotransferase